MFLNKELMMDLLSVLFPTAKIYLFGSRARGTHQETSDIDLAIDRGSRISTLEMARARNIIEALNIPQMIDLVDLQSVPAEMKALILSEGVLWKS